MKVPRILLLFLTINFSIFSANIIKINIKGNKNISYDRILTMIKTREGIEFDEKILKNDITILLKTGYFKDVKYYTEEKEDGIELNIEVEENPVIERIVFEGNKVLKTKKLREIFDVKEGDVLNEEKIINGIEKIRQEYNRIGYKTSQIDYQVEEKEGKCIINISIIEKGKGYVQKIVFVGNNQVSERNLRKLLKTKERKMPFIRGIYKEDVFQEDIKRIKDYYNERGFVEVKIEKEVEYKEDGITITFLINEGKRYFTGEIKLEGDIIFNEDEIRKLILLKRGDVFNVKKNEESLKNIHKFYVEKGYIRCNVEFIPEIRGDSLNVIYLIQPGTVYYTEEVKIKGNRITKDKVIRREVKLEPGDEITQEKIKKTFNNLRDTNYFEDIRIYPEFVEEGKANIVVDVKEREKTGIFLIGGGYSTLDKFIGMVSIQQTNFDITNPPKFVGGGQNLSLLFEIGTTTKNYKFSFTEPYFLDRPISLGPDIYRYEITRYDWKAISNGFDLRIGRRWENFNIGFKLLTEKVELTDVDIPSEVEGIKRKNSITTYLTFSNLDSERFPTKGDKIKCGIEFAGLGGDLNFLKTTLENNFYYPLKNMIFHSRTLIGYIDNEVPIYERFFGGGIGTVRGYRERSLGPRIIDNQGIVHYLGGKVILAQNFEILYPLYKDIFYLIGFFDIGNVYEDWNNINELKKGFGAGIRVNVPFFGAPLEVYYGYGPDAEIGEPKRRVHIGMSFGF